MRNVLRLRLPVDHFAVASLRRQRFQELRLRLQHHSYSRSTQLLRMRRRLRLQVKGNTYCKKQETESAFAPTLFFLHDPKRLSKQAEIPRKSDTCREKTIFRGASGCFIRALERVVRRRTKRRVSRRRDAVLRCTVQRDAEKERKGRTRERKYACRVFR